MENSSHHRAFSFGALVLCIAVIAILPGAPARADDSECIACHEKLGRQFETTVHGRIKEWETLAGKIGCTSCHGNGAAHIDSGGDPEQIQSLNDVAQVETIVAACAKCHRSGTTEDWMGSEHQVNGVGCSDCHRMHENPGKIARFINNCAKCHPDVQARLQYPSHHPIREGRMSCTSCHDPHGSSFGMLLTEERPQDLCFKCHGEQQGPFLFEHDPVFEGCDTCHDPHGAVANNLLVQNEPFLCLQCHELHFHAGLEGEETDTGQWYIPGFDPGVAATGRLPRDTYPNGMMPIPNGAAGYKTAFVTKCTQCHSQVHGSDSPSQTVPGFGKGLLR